MELKLCDSDYRFMMVVWNNEPIRSTQLAKLCNEELGWKKSTTFSEIKKLSFKGFIQNVDAVVTSLVAKEDCQREEVQHFMERTFKGSLPDFLVSFLGSSEITDSEIEEARKVIDNYKKNRK